MLSVVPVREASVVIAVSAVHRADAMAATSWLIDELKATVPVWKKACDCIILSRCNRTQEVYGDGSSSWKENCECMLARDKIKLQHQHDHAHGHGHSHGDLRNAASESHEHGE